MLLFIINGTVGDMRVMRYLGWANALYTWEFSTLDINICIYTTNNYNVISSQLLQLYDVMDWHFSYMIFGKWAINEFVIDLHQHFVSDTVTFCRHLFEGRDGVFLLVKYKRNRTIF